MLRLGSLRISTCNPRTQLCPRLNAEGRESEGRVKQLTPGEFDEIISTKEMKEDRSIQASILEKIANLQATETLVGFGQARRVPKRPYTLAELKLNKIDTTKLLRPKEEALQQVEMQLQLAFLSLVIFSAFNGGFDVNRAGILIFSMLTLLTLDQITLAGGVRTLIIDTAGTFLAPKYRERVAYHEAGHFLIAYLMGVLPLAFSISSLDAVLKYKAWNVQAGCRFADSQLTKEIQSGQVRASTLQSFTCIGLAGICAEYVKFGEAEGGSADIEQVDLMFRSLQVHSLVQPIQSAVRLFPHP